MSAVLTAAAPWLERRWRRLGWVLLVGVSVDPLPRTRRSRSTRCATSWSAGSPGAAVLVRSGARSDVRPAQHRRRAGRGRGAAGAAGAGQRRRPRLVALLRHRRRRQQLFVKALGEDQRSADLLFRVYRWAQRRDLGDERPFSSLRRGVEHEALVALAARDLGMRTPRLAAFATAEPNAYVLAYEAIDGRSLDRLEPDEMTDDVLAAIWEQVAPMRRHRVAHRDLRLANVFLADDGAVWMIDFGFSELAASDLLLTNDVAELLASSTLQVGAGASGGRRPPRRRHATVLADALDRLQPWALSGATRTGLKETTRPPGRAPRRGARGLAERLAVPKR